MVLAWSDRVGEVMEASNSTAKDSTALRMAFLLVAAVVIGLAYNSVTPLGVALGAKPAKPIDSEPAPSVGTGRGFQNQVIQVSWKTDSDFHKEPMLLAEGPSGKKLTWEETQSLLAANQIVLVDARDSLSYQTEHIPGAVSLPETSSEADLANFASKYPPDTALVIYCNSLKCPMGHKLAATLRSKKWGFTNIREMPGGFAEYRASMQHR